MNNKLAVVDEPISLFDQSINSQLIKYSNSIVKSIINREEISLAYIYALMALKHLSGKEYHFNKIVYIKEWTLWMHISPHPQGCQPDANHSSAHCNAGQVCVWHKGQFIAILKPEGGHGMTHFSIQDKGTGQPIEDNFIAEMENALKEHRKRIDASLKLYINETKLIE